MFKGWHAAVGQNIAVSGQPQSTRGRSRDVQSKVPSSGRSVTQVGKGFGRTGCQPTQAHAHYYQSVFNTGTPVPQPPRILVVVVLYRMRPQDSPALQSITALLTGTPEYGERSSLFVWDNSPATGHNEAPAEHSEAVAPYQYRHDPTNPGLNAAYTAALHLAAERGCEWLMLLDQDTTVTAAYLREVLTTSADLASGRNNVAALVPRLVQDGTVVSPFHPSAQGPVQPIDPNLFGMATKPLQAFNSGAVLRVQALQSIGGFDEAFPLEYLDHATFAALQRAAGTVYVLCASLQHDLSTQTTGPLSEAALARQRSILAAEHRFVARYGTAAQRRMLPVRTLRHALSVLWHKHDLRHAMLILRTAFAGGSKAA